MNSQKALGVGLAAQIVPTQRAFYYYYYKMPGTKRKIGPDPQGFRRKIRRFLICSPGVQQICRSVTLVEILVILRTSETSP